MSSTISDPISSHLKSLYTTYRRTTSIAAKGAFFSPECMQICRPQPNYAAGNRETIVQFLHDAVKAGTNLATAGQSDGEVPENAGDFKHCTIRPLRMNDCEEGECELEFGDDQSTLPVGFTALELKDKAEREGWRGMRVDLWVDEGMGMDILVKVRYWWRIQTKEQQVGENKEGDNEDDEWVQILHDIIYMGPRDGTEGKEGEFLL